MSEKFLYLRQWQRVIRWYGRFKEISECKNISQISEYDEDDVFAFFINCYHLKDWIKSDPSQREMGGKVEEFINKSTYLSICANLCNGLKHYSIDRIRGLTTSQFGDKTQRVYLNETPIVVRQGYTVVAGNKKFDAFDFATQCMMEWHEFIYLNRMN